MTAPAYLRASQAARLLHVDPKTVNRWTREGKLPHMRTLGGHYRYPAEAVHELVRTLAFSPDGGDLDG